MQHNVGNGKKANNDNGKKYRQTNKNISSMRINTPPVSNNYYVMERVPYIKDIEY